MKRVVVSMRIDEYPDREERRDAVDQDLIRFIFDAGFFPVLVPNSMVDVGGSGRVAGSSEVVAGGGVN